MDVGSNDKVKVYAVIGLVVIAGLVAYFRFFRKAAPSRTRKPATATTEAAYEIPELPAWLEQGTPMAARERAPYDPPARDIFAPQRDPQVDPEPAPEPVAPPPGPPKLTAIIMGAQGAVAMIDGQLARAGEKVRGYTVVEITRRVAVLRKDGDLLKLTIGE